MSKVAFCGAEPGFKEATDLCSGFEVVEEAEADVAKDFPPTICHLGRILRAVGLVTSSFDAVETFLDAAAALLLSMDKIYRSFFIWPDPPGRRGSHCLKITQNIAFEFWHFAPICVQLKLTRLVTLLVRKLQVFTRQIEHFGICNELL